LGSLLSLCLALPFWEEASPTSSGTRMDSGKKSLLTSRMDVDTLVLFYSSSRYGILDAMFQSLVYWIIGTLANDSQTLSR
jgi:hypothetical protein